MIKISWQDINSLVDILAEDLKDFEYIKNVFGVPRGGFIPAVMLSHKLNLPMIWDKNEIEELTLVVDDLVDTGGTMARLNKEKKFISAVLYKKPDTKFDPQFVAEHLTDNNWLLFPWETEDTSKYDHTI